MKKLLSLIVALMMALPAFGIADERGSFYFEPFQGGAMGVRFIDVTVDEDADIMSLWVRQDVTNVVLEKLTWDAYMMAETVFHADSLASNQVINLKAYLYDVMPAFRVSCVNAAGQEERWYLADSGEDGSLLLLDAAEVESWTPDLFDELAGLQFIFSSGAGAWSTFLTIQGGAFTGEFHDAEMGERADAYPNGSEYGCLFHGEMTYAGQIDEYSFALQCASLELDEGQIPELIADGVHYVTTAPYGLENAGILTLYAPGCPVDSLPEALLPWLHLEDMPGDKTVLQTYVLYSPADESGFVGYPAENGAEP